MATVLNNIDIQVNSQTALEYNREMLVPIVGTAALRTETQESVVEGDTIQVPLLTKAADGTAYDDSINNYLTDNGETHTWKQVSIDKHFKKTFKIKASEWARLTPKDIQDMMNSNMTGLLSGYIKDMFALITAANFGAAGFTGAATTFDADDLVDLRRAIVAATGRKMGIKGVFNGAFYDAVLKDTQVTSVNVFGDSDPARAANLALGIRGFEGIYETEIIPDNAENLEGFVSTGNGIAMANVIVPPPARFRRAC